MTTHRRPGYTLVETLVVLTVSAAILTLTAGTIHLLLKLDRSGRSASDEAADLARLARDFRADAHAAAPGREPERSPGRIAIAREGGATVEYLARPDDILRTLKEGEKVRRRETYRRPSRASVRFDTDRQGARSFAVLVVDRPLDGVDDSAYRDCRIEAELGSDHRTDGRPR